MQLSNSAVGDWQNPKQAACDKFSDNNPPRELLEEALVRAVTPPLLQQPPTPAASEPWGRNGSNAANIHLQSAANIHLQGAVAGQLRTTNPLHVRFLRRIL